MEILSQNEQDKDLEVAGLEDLFLCPPSNQFSKQHTPSWSKDQKEPEIESTPGFKEMQPIDVEHVQFKRMKISNMRYREYINPLVK